MKRRAPFLLVLVLGACSLWRHDEPERIVGTLYSPNGEPLSGGPLGHPKCEDALGRWFDRVDVNHDGVIDRQEFVADAGRQFAAMDLDKDGALTPPVLARYRAPYAVEPATRAPTSDEQREVERRRRRGDNANEAPIGEDRTDPVMIADVTLHNRVTRDQFLAYAGRNFAVLDVGHDGRLTRAELLKTCAPRS